jgi:hypothetical protein
MRFILHLTFHLEAVFQSRIFPKARKVYPETHYGTHKHLPSFCFEYLLFSLRWILIDGKPSGVRQAMLMLPEGANWEGLRLKAELEVKGILHPVQWACQQKINSDGSLTLKRNLRS